VNTVDADNGEQPLPVGCVNAVTRVGDTVRQARSPNTTFVHRLLALFQQQHWPGAPRFLGIDDQQREVLRHIDGHVPWQPPHPRDEPSLVRVARLVREFHDLTAGTDLAGDQEVVCHNDLSPKNTVPPRKAPSADAG
jgi:hypothetical protein